MTNFTYQFCDHYRHAKEAILFYKKKKQKQTCLDGNSNASLFVARIQVERLKYALSTEDEMKERGPYVYKDRFCFIGKTFVLQFYNAI